MEKLNQEQLVELVKVLLNERAIARIYLKEFEKGFLNRKLTKKAYFEVINRLYKNTDDYDIMQGL